MGEKRGDPKFLPGTEIPFKKTLSAEDIARAQEKIIPLDVAQAKIIDDHHIEVLDAEEESPKKDEQAIAGLRDFIKKIGTRISGKKPPEKRTLN